ncbi:ATP-binding protein [Brevibacterium litoralis]|uniref:ATP-binding protein n=1 Tax=Brevibacterium litoralis TaxID=3138935 RepID=UPI0032F013E6
MTTEERARQVVPPEDRYAEELAFLAAHDPGPRPHAWRLTPRAVVTFVMGSEGPLALEEPTGDLPDSLTISQKYVGDRALVERCVVTLAGSRGLLLTGEPGTAKSMLSELLSAAICGSSAFVVQGTAGTTEDHLRYGWNYGQLLATGPSTEALVPSPLMMAMERGAVARVEEITRCLPEVQDALVSLLSERRIAVPELGDHAVAARPGFALIGTANLRDRGVTEMSAALKRRFSFERIDPIADRYTEVALVTAQVRSALAESGVPTAHAEPDTAVIDALVTAFRDLRTGRTAEGWSVERPSTVLSTAEAVATASTAALSSAWFPADADVQGSGDTVGASGAGASVSTAALAQVPRLLMGAVRKDDPADADTLRGYWDLAVSRRAEAGDPVWSALWDLRDRIRVWE